MTNNTLIFIDARITGYQKLLDGLPQGAEVVLLSPAEDGLAQINSYLTGRSGLDAIHLISHGSQGALYLGGSVLNADTLAGYTAQLQQLGQALSATGDLLLYGCNVASGDEGMAFITRLSTLTGADVAASTDLTGAAVLGGNAVLEAATGSIEATGVLTVETLAELDAVLLVPLLGTPSSQMSTSNTLANFTVNAGSDRLLVVAVGDPDSTIAPTSVTFNGTAMTLANTVTDGNFANNTIWHLKLGDSISSVTGNIVVTFATNTGNTKFLSATAFTAVDQLTPVDSGGPHFGINSSSNAGSSLNVTSQSGDLVLDIFDAFVVNGTNAASFTIGGGQTLIHSQAAAQFGGFGAYVMSTEPGAANVNMSWSSNAGEVRHAAVNINQAAPNVAPSGADIGLQISEDTTLTLSLANFGFSDAADATPNVLKAVKISTLPFLAFLTHNGAAVTTGQFITAADINNGLLKFTPGANIVGSSGFGFQVQDLGGTANGGVDLDPSENFVTISINGVNDTPVVSAGKTFTSSGSLTLTDNSTVNQTINVSGLAGAISNITVTISGLTHTFPDDLDFLLVAPDGSSNLLFLSDAGGDPNVSNLTLTLTDAGTAFVPDATLIAPGTTVNLFSRRASAGS